MAGLPLDVAADAGFLIAGDRFAVEDGFERGAQVTAGDGQAVAGSAVVELSAVDESLFAVEEVEVRGASGAIGLGDGLGFVEEIREQKTGGGDFLGHFCGAVGGVILNVVRVDTDDGHAPGEVIARELRETFADMLHIGAMVAHEDHDEGGGILEIVEGDRFTGGVGESERGGQSSQGQHGGRCQSHGRSMVEWGEIVEFLEQGEPIQWDPASVCPAKPHSTARSLEPFGAYPSASVYLRRFSGECQGPAGLPRRSPALAGRRRERSPYQTGPDARSRVLDGTFNGGLAELVPPADAIRISGAGIR